MPRDSSGLEAGGSNASVIPTTVDNLELKEENSGLSTVESATNLRGECLVRPRHNHAD